MMKMTPQRKALDKIYKRRDRYEIPDWQRDEVWGTAKKQQLIDSILRGWRLPKLYVIKIAPDQYEVLDGQQRLTAIYEFFSNDLALSKESAKHFGATHYKDLPSNYSDAFDDFEIDFDEIEDATEADQKAFFQRLQEGLPLTGSEKLNSVHSKLRDFCKSLAKHAFLKNAVSVADTRYAHFDIIAKVAVLELEGLDAGFRYDDMKPVFDANVAFSTTSAAAKRIKAALDFLAASFPSRVSYLRNRTVVQSLITFVCGLVASGNAKGLEDKIGSFVKEFMAELSKQVELGQAATDHDYLRFQRSINANVKSGPRNRQEILLRKAFTIDPTIAAAFDPSVLVESGINGRIRELGEAIAAHIERRNEEYSAKHGIDLFKATNKTTAALTACGKSIKGLNEYKELLSKLYFLFKEGVGTRLDDKQPESFADINTLRTESQHDTDHGDKAKVKAKKKKAASVFKKYSGAATPDSLDPGLFVLVQANLLTAVERDLALLELPQ